MPAVYESQRWLFERAPGRFDIDLSISGMAPRDCGELFAEAESRAAYGLDRGDRALRELIAEAYRVDASQVLVTNGAQEAMYLLMAAHLRAGHRVAVHTPGWQQLTHLPERFGAEVVRVPAGDGAELDLAGLAAAARDADLIVLNSPHNPTGLAVDPDAGYAALSPAVAGRDVVVVNDEEYLTDYADSIVHQVPRACSVSSLSKVYGFPGLRTGWLVGPRPVVETCVNYRRYTTISNSPILESLAALVLNERKRYVTEYVDALAERWRQFAAWADAQPWLRYRPPARTPFVLCAYHVPLDDLSLCERLLDEERVLLMPGSVFGAPGTVRISYARPADVLADGLARISRVLGSLG